jgi:hypothetical protein
MTLAVSLKDYPTFDYFLEVKFSFKLTITSACTNAVFGSISSEFKPNLISNYLENGDNVDTHVDALILKVYDETDWNVMTFDAVMDSVSHLAVNSFSRALPPSKPQFCGGT